MKMFSSHATAIGGVLGNWLRSVLHATLRGERKEAIVIVLWCLGVGVIVCWVSLTLRLDTRQDALYNLNALLHGAPLRFDEALRGDLPFYNRILFPSLHRAFSRVFPAVSGEQWYVWLRIASYQGAFLAFALVCHFNLRAPRSATGLATAILALATIAGFNHRWEEPTDALDLMAIALGVGAIVRRRFILCLVLSVVFATNRESAAFLGVAWFVLLATRQDGLRRAMEGSLIFAASYGTALAIRWMLAPRAMNNFNTQSVNIRSLLEALASFDPLSWLVVLGASFLLFLPFLDLARPRTSRFVALGMLLLLPTVSFGLINELRVFLPTFTLLAFSIADGFEERASGQLKECPR